MFKNIFNAKAIVERMKGDHGANIYHRFNNAINGNIRGMTVSMIAEIEAITKRESKKMLDHLAKMKKDVAAMSEEKQAA